MNTRVRYFIRGLGIGIIFTALVMIFSLHGYRSRIKEEYQMSKEDIIQKASAYGMIMAYDTDAIKKQEEENKADDKADDKESDAIKEDNAMQTTEDTEKKDTENKDTEQKDTTIKDTENKDTTIKDTTKTDTAKKEQDDNYISINYIPFTITEGMAASSVCNELESVGAIKDAGEFKQFITENGYASSIRTGEYLIPVDSSYQAIVEIISKKKTK